MKSVYASSSGVGFHDVMFARSGMRNRDEQATRRCLGIARMDAVNMKA
jgi:hypothetical protein